MDLLLGFADGARDGAGAAAAGGGAAAAARGGSAAATTAAAVAVAASLLPVTATGPVMWWCSLFSLSSSVQRSGRHPLLAVAAAADADARVLLFLPSHDVDITGRLLLTLGCASISLS